MAEAAPQASERSLQDRVADIINAIRPAVQGDGGDIELVNVDDKGVVSLRLHGACVGCPSSTMTLKMGIERHLKEKVPEVAEVVCV
jgi:Fe-S cluster biogenesis protein NfuA